MKQVIQDVDGRLSSKRIITLISMVTLIILFAVDIFTKFSVSENILNVLEWIIIAGLGIVGSERFSKRTQNKNR